MTFTLPPFVEPLHDLVHVAIRTPGATIGTQT
jgi:hypothetical protein